MREMALVSVTRKTRLNQGVWAGKGLGFSLTPASQRAEFADLVRSSWGVRVCGSLAGRVGFLGHNQPPRMSPEVGSRRLPMPISLSGKLVLEPKCRRQDMFVRTMSRNSLEDPRRY